LGVSAASGNPKSLKLQVFSARFRFRPGEPVKTITYDILLEFTALLSRMQLSDRLSFRIQSLDRGSNPLSDIETSTAQVSDFVAPGFSSETALGVFLGVSRNFYI
jgi:hypothetical protein